jgi:hypothetical protein
VPAETTLSLYNNTDGGNNSPRKRKSPIQNNNDLQQFSDDHNNEGATIGENLGISQIENYFVRAREELQNASYGKTNYWFMA